jgi:hypothetical protein
MPVKKEIIYPIFLECCKFAVNIYWENIFESLAYGVCPYGTYISKDFICCSYKKKEFSYKIDNNKDPELIYNELYNLLTEKLGLISQEEKLRKKNDYNQNENINKDNWNDIRKKNIREILIELYVLKVKNKYNLSFNQIKYLFSMISIGLMLKIILSKDIIIKNGMIDKIEGINFENGRIIFDKNFYNVEPEFIPEILITRKMMIDNWEKYLKDLIKIKENI